MPNPFRFRKPHQSSLLHNLNSTPSNTSVVLDQAPVFELELKDQIIMEMSQLKLTCKVNAHPKPTMTWYHANTKLTKASGGSRGVQIGLEKGKAFLTISKIGKRDGGQYKCVATNKAGTAESVANLTVAGKYFSYAPATPTTPTPNRQQTEHNLHYPR